MPPSAAAIKAGCNAPAAPHQEQGEEPEEAVLDALLSSIRC